MPLAAEFLEILVCPQSREPLVYFEQGAVEGDAPFLFCPASKLKYRIEDDDIPVLLVEDAVQLDDDEAAALMNLARERGIT